MQHFSIPTCYFPSTVLFLDDRHDILLDFVLHLDEGVAYRTFDAPQKALAYIHNKRCELDQISEQCWGGYTETKYCPLTHQTINLALVAMHAEIYNRYRFSEISVVVVDYTTPWSDGLAFCSRIDNCNIKKILLIDPSDEKLAMAACHDGLIDRYLKKNDIDVEAQLRKSIYELQLQYFKTMSGMILRLLSLPPPRCLLDKGFAQFFLKFREALGIIEFYLVDNSGSFLMLDNEANTSLLIVKTEADIRLHVDSARNSGASEAILEQLTAGEKIPGFWLSEGGPQRLHEGLNCLVPAEQFVSDTTYYYATVKGNTWFDVDQQKILSYHRYLEELDAEIFLMDKGAFEMG